MSHHGMHWGMFAFVGGVESAVPGCWQDGPHTFRAGQCPEPSAVVSRDGWRDAALCLTAHRVALPSSTSPLYRPRVPSCSAVRPRASELTAAEPAAALPAAAAAARGRAGRDASV